MKSYAYIFDDESDHVTVILQLARQSRISVWCSIIIAIICAVICLSCVLHYSIKTKTCCDVQHGVQYS